MMDSSAVNNLTFTFQKGMLFNFGSVILFIKCPMWAKMLSLAAVLMSSILKVEQTALVIYNITVTAFGTVLLLGKSCQTNQEIEN